MNERTVRRRICCSCCFDWVGSTGGRGAGTLGRGRAGVNSADALARRSREREGRSVRAGADSRGKIRNEGATDGEDMSYAGRERGVGAMLIRNKAKFAYSDVTPKAVYLDRRALMAGAAGLAAAALAPGSRRAAAKLPAAPSPLLDRRGADGARAHHQLQQLLRVRPRQGRSGEATPARLTTAPWSVVIDGLVGRPGTYALEDIVEPRAARGAHLPAALRRGLVDGDPLDRLSARRRDRARRAGGRGEIRRLRDAGAARGDAGAARRLPDARLALCRGAAARRGDAPADHPRGRALRRGRCRTRTARRCGWWCRGSTASSRSSRSCASA